MSDIKQGWKKIPLKDACEVFTDGDWIETKHQSSEGIRLVQTGNIGFGFYKDKADKARYISEETFVELKCTEILPNDLLVSRLPDPVGKSCLIPDLQTKMITGVDCTIIRTKDYLTPEFLLYYQMSNQYLSDVNSKVTGTTRSRISRKNLGLVEIPIPPLEEQKQIVAVLDKAFAAIDLAKANIEKNLLNAKELFQSKLNEIFTQKGEGWEDKKLIEVNRFIDYRGRTPKKTTEGIRLITAKNVKMGVLNRKPEEFIHPDNYDEWMTRGIPQKGDVLFTTEAPLANVALLDTNEKIALAQRIITLCPDREILTGEYLHYCIQSKEVQDKILEKGTGATVTGIKSRLLKEIVIPIPPINEQEDMVKLLDRLLDNKKQLEAIYRKEVNNLTELKKSILQKAFAGELT